MTYDKESIMKDIETALNLQLSYSKDWEKFKQRRRDIMQYLTENLK
jgi:hypothetical protein